MMEIRFPGRGRNTQKAVAGKGEIYSYSQDGDEVLAIVRLADRSFVTARIPTNIDCPEIGVMVELLPHYEQNVIRASVSF